ncbi:MAG UNVERIFIED_CONTAM: cation diffusion facilitator family transporter [Rickettsiaceae bacterium]
MSNHSKLLTIAPWYSVITAAIIVVVKLYGWLITDSVSLMASFMDALLDLSTSIINLIALRAALAPPDHNHRFGHNKIEDLAVFGQSIGFFCSGVFTFYNAIKHTVSPFVINNIDIGIYTMVICSVLTIFLIIFQSFTIKRTKSSIIEADRLHYMSDLLTNICVIVSLYFSSIFVQLDALFGILIACYILHSSYGLFVKATRNLIDEELNDEERKKIVDIISKHKEVIGIHEIKTRRASSKIFIQFHLEMDGEMKLFEAHELSDRIVMKILEVFPEAEVIIHQDPAGFEDDASYREEI